MCRQGRRGVSITAAKRRIGLKKFLLAVTAFTTIEGSALAADLAVRRPPPPAYVQPVVVPLYTWTGCYVGGNAGGLWARTEWNDSVFGDFGTGTASGGLGGLQGGCNYQTGAWVFGIQGDYDWTSATNDTTNVFLSNFTGLAVTNHREIEFARVRHRTSWLCVGSPSWLRKRRRRLGTRLFQLSSRRSYHRNGQRYTRRMDGWRWR